MIKLMLFILWLCGVGFGIAISLLVDFLTDEVKSIGEDDDLDIYYHIINNEWYVSVEDYKKLKNRISEAIEYIEENIEGNYFKRYDEVYKMCEDLLGILKGDDNE